MSNLSIPTGIQARIDEIRQRNHFYFEGDLPGHP